MLVHHPDPDPSRLAGRVGPPRLAPHPHRACVRSYETVSQVHEGGLPCAILAKECVHFPGTEREIGPAQGLHGAETLRDAAELERGATHRGATHMPVGWR